LIAGTPSCTLRLGSSGDEVLVSGGRGERAGSSGGESLESRGRGERARGDRSRGGWSLGADLDAAVRLRGGGDGDKVRSQISGGGRCREGSSSSLIRSITSCGCWRGGGLDLTAAAPRDGREAMKLPDTRAVCGARNVCERWLMLGTIFPGLVV
jgi:hypothetical protein